MKKIKNKMSMKKKYVKRRRLLVIAAFLLVSVGVYILRLPLARSSMEEDKKYYSDLIKPREVDYNYETNNREDVDVTDLEAIKKAVYPDNKDDYIINEFANKEPLVSENIIKYKSLIENKLQELDIRLAYSNIFLGVLSEEYRNNPAIFNKDNAEKHINFLVNDFNNHLDYVKKHNLNLYALIQSFNYGDTYLVYLCENGVEPSLSSSKEFIGNKDVDGTKDAHYAERVLMYMGFSNEEVNIYTKTK